MPEMRLKKFCVLSFHRKSMFGILLPLSAYLSCSAKEKKKKNVKKKWRHFSNQLNANFDFTALSRIATLKAGKLHLEIEVNK